MEQKNLSHPSQGRASLREKDWGGGNAGKQPGAPEEDELHGTPEKKGWVSTLVPQCPGHVASGVGKTCPCREDKGINIPLND